MESPHLNFSGLTCRSFRPGGIRFDSLTFEKICRCFETRRMKSGTPRHRATSPETPALMRGRDMAKGRGAPTNPARRARQGGLVRLTRGVYADASRPLSENATLAAMALRYPEAVVCLISALRFHELTTQSPGELWLAVDRKAHAPTGDNPPLRVVRFSGQALTSGVETHLIDGVPVRVTSVAKTVADCFKYRNKIGLDVALEALRETLRNRRTTMDAIWREAKVCRMTRVMRPYLEALS